MSKNKQQLFFLFSILTCTVLIFSFGCKREIITPSSITFNYFPIDVGRWIEYKVDSIYHSEVDNHNDDSIYEYHFEIKDKIDSSYIDIEGRNIQVIKRFHRTDSLSEWSLSNVWTQRLNNLNAYRTEDNITFHKLSFPITYSTTWNSNDANTYDEELCSYQYFHEPGYFNSISFDSTLSVLESDDDNYIMRKFSNEIYASGVGLIYKERKDLEKNNGVIVSGLEYIMTVKAFGKD